MVAIETAKTATEIPATARFLPIFQLVLKLVVEIRVLRSAAGCNHLLQSPAATCCNLMQLFLFSRKVISNSGGRVEVLIPVSSTRAIDIARKLSASSSSQFLIKEWRRGDLVLSRAFICISNWLTTCCKEKFLFWRFSDVFATNDVTNRFFLLFSSL